MNGRLLIGLVGFAGSGKDTACLALGASRCAFADALKAVIDPLFPPGTPKEIRRPVYVAYGEAMRKIDPDYWAKLLRIPDAPLVCVTDVRYVNEANHVLARRGKLVYLFRRGVDAANKEEHRSIGQIMDKFSDTPVVPNAGTPEQLAAAVLNAVEG